MKQFFICLLSILFCINHALHADEGMWMLNQLPPKAYTQMQQLGLELTSEQLYSSNGKSLHKAIISFGGFCSGVIVSPSGLIFTNHHCGFSAIQQHSSPENDYLKNGFIAHGYEEELPNPDLYVSFLLSTENVTNRILIPEILAISDEYERQDAIDSIKYIIENEIESKDSLLRAIVSPYHSGNEYYLSIYQDYEDIRLVFAPPSSIGKFGGDTDNWVWPRHTGDFSVFRIYADSTGYPAKYSPDNIPLHTETYAQVSIDGYEEGSFSMTLGYPGETQRYLSSFGVTERMHTDNAAMIQVRGIKQAIWREAMDADEAIRIKYDSKYAISSNYWKNSIGMNKSIEKLQVLERKRNIEDQLRQWIQSNPGKRNQYVHILTELELNYRNRLNSKRAIAFFIESFANAPEVLRAALMILNFDDSEENPNYDSQIRELIDLYNNLDTLTDRRTFAAMLENYRNEIPQQEFWPDVYQEIDTLFNNDIDAYSQWFYSNSHLSNLDKTFETMKDSTQSFFEDPAIAFAIDIMVKYYDFSQQTREATMAVEMNERLLNKALIEMREEQELYPDANSTLRLSFGFVGGYSPQDGIHYKHFTTTQGIFEKVSQYKGYNDFWVQPKLLETLSKREFGKFTDPHSGELQVCFITNNDITGGNSGSPIFNGKGELIGLAFDGNWEAMSSDLFYEPQLQRCVGVDIRYALYMIHISGGEELLREIEEPKQ